MLLHTFTFLYQRLLSRFCIYNDATEISTAPTIHVIIIITWLEQQLAITRIADDVAWGVYVTYGVGG